MLNDIPIVTGPVAFCLGIGVLMLVQRLKKAWADEQDLQHRYAITLEQRNEALGRCETLQRDLDHHLDSRNNEMMAAIPREAVIVPPAQHPISALTLHLDVPDATIPNDYEVAKYLGERDVMIAILKSRQPGELCDVWVRTGTDYRRLGQYGTFRLQPAENGLYFEDTGAVMPVNSPMALKRPNEVLQRSTSDRHIRRRML